MKKILLFLSFSCLFITCNGQVPASRAHCQNSDFDKKVANMLSFTVKTISPSDLKRQSNVVVLDARERSEYDVSHLPNAVFIGYNSFEKKALDTIQKDRTIVVYCSIGYRSEKMGEKLTKLGYTKVFNLYGSIFEWLNQGYPVVDKNGQPTKKVHTYNKAWSRWVEEGKAEKIW
jgi:rhodanese-related sulfurtransferase